jgi:deoxyribonuclease V
MNEELIKRIFEISNQRLIEEAIELQKTLFSKISFEENIENVESIGGVDISYSNDEGFCSIVILAEKGKEIIQVVNAKRKVKFPYIPGLLFFREFPVFFSAFRKLKKIPEILMFDGHGLTHPRMMGIATMAGIVLDIPTIGCAKSPLYGDYKEPEEKKFSSSPIKNSDVVVGYVLRSKPRCKPIFISSGYRISPQSALNITLKFITDYRLPLPTYYAHKYSNFFRNE